MTGDMLDVMPLWPAESVSCAVFSPPYWAMRLYRVAARAWGGDPACVHAWSEPVGPPRPCQTADPKRAGEHAEVMLSERGRFCSACGAWLGQLGQEPTVEMYVGHVVEVLRVVRRVLHRSGTVWLNVADTYMSAPSWGRGKSSGLDGRKHAEVADATRLRGSRRASESGIVTKNLCLIPERIILALQTDGWIVRSRVTWRKISAMPSSTTDRPTASTEPIFLLSKRGRYFYDVFAEREMATLANGHGRQGALWSAPEEEPVGESVDGRQMRDVWDIADEPLIDTAPLWSIGSEPLRSMDHVAPWPREVPRRCIRLGVSQGGYCARCMEPFRRVLRKSANGRLRERASGGGWEPACRCGAEPVPGIVCDPFSGSGRTLEVALGLGLRAVGTELNPLWAEQSRRRLAEYAGPVMEVRS